MYTLISDSAFRLRFCVCDHKQPTKPVYTVDKEKDKDKAKEKAKTRTKTKNVVGKSVVCIDRGVCVSTIKAGLDC